MSRIEKLLKKFNLNPESIRYSELENILFHYGFEKVPAKGSHVKFKHRKLQNDIIIPIHNNDCKSFYKLQIKKQINSVIKII